MIAAQTRPSNSETIGVARDITDRQQAEEELRASEEQLRAVWEHSIDGMRLTDHRGRIIAVNEAYCRLVKLPRERLLGELFSVTYAEKGMEGRLDDYLERFRTGEVIARRTTRARLWNGEDVDLDIATSFVEMGQRGRLILTIFRDITERQRAEEALETTQKRLAHFLEETPAVIYSLKHEGTTFVPAWYSHYLEELLGFSPEEACRPEWWLQQVHPSDRGTLQKWLTVILEHKRVTREYRIRHKNGQYLWLHDEQRLVCDHHGEPMEVVGSWVDVTRHKALQESQRLLEAQLRQAQKMEAIGQLAGGVAHDFNNLLLVISGNAELLQLQEDPLSEPVKDCLRQVTAAAERAGNLTRQLLAFSRKQVMQAQPLILDEVIVNLAKMLKRLIGEHINLKCHYSVGLPHIEADAGMMEQILVNLVVNARDAMPRGGDLDISTERVVLRDSDLSGNSEARTGEFVCLTVRDSGSGIAPEHMPHLFEPFFTTKQPGKGTGLGLATVYGIVKQHQGWIEVASRPGAGSTFRIYLPTVPSPAPKTAAPQAESAPRGGTEAILVVEDEAAVRQITRRMLERAGYKIYEAPRAKEAFELFAAHGDEIALLLTDIVMPDGVDGRELAADLRTRKPALKILLMSGYSGENVGNTSRFLQKTRAHFLQKPCRARDLLETVRHTLDEQDSD